VRFNTLAKIKRLVQNFPEVQVGSVLHCCNTLLQSSRSPGDQYDLFTWRRVHSDAMAIVWVDRPHCARSVTCRIYPIVVALPSH